ncbi:MAG: hypothetical protein I4O49_21555 [Janthinobacterium lividum]|nr:hypothetical protein [Janthinobacterium lividum]
MMLDGGEHSLNSNVRVLAIGSGENYQLSSAQFSLAELLSPRFHVPRHLKKSWHGRG